MKEPPSEHRLFTDALAGLDQASGACSQLIHQHGGDPRWMIMRDAVEMIKDECRRQASVSAMISLAVRPA